MIDAPVSGSVGAAEDGTWLIMAGCTEIHAAPLRPLLEALGRADQLPGRARPGAVMKRAVNALIHGINQSLAETMTLAGATGIDAAQAFDVIKASDACAPVPTYRQPLYLDQAVHQTSFTVALARKDMEPTAALAERVAVALPQGAVTLYKHRRAEAAGFAARDMASMLDFIRKEGP